MPTCGECGEPNHTTARNGFFSFAALRTNSSAASTMTSEPSPVVFTALPLRAIHGSTSKKFGLENHWSKPLRPGDTGLSARIEPRCHLPK